MSRYDSSGSERFLRQFPDRSKSIVDVNSVFQITMMPAPAGSMSPTKKCGKRVYKVTKAPGAASLPTIINNIPTKTVAN